MRAIIFMMALLLTLAAGAQEPDYKPGRLVLKFKKEVKHLSCRGDLPKFDIQQLDTICNQYGCYRIHRLKRAKDGYGGVYLLYFPDSVYIPALTEVFENTGLFREVEPDYIGLLESLPFFQCSAQSAVYISTDIMGAVNIVIHFSRPFIRPLIRRAWLH